jgi:hypothetical protein
MIKILRSKSGLSLFFVLGLMLTLLALGVSVLTAAGLSRGAGLAQRNRSQLNLYMSSMEHTLLAMLQNELGDWLIEDAIQKAFSTAIAPRTGSPDWTFSQIVVPVEISLTTEEDVAFLGAEYTVEIQGELRVSFSDYRRFSILIPWSFSTQLTAGIFGEVSVAVITEFGTMRTASRTTFSYRNGMLEERDYGLKTNHPSRSDMDFAKGEWRITGRATTSP